MSKKTDYLALEVKITREDWSHDALVKATIEALRNIADHMERHNSSALQAGDSEGGMALHMEYNTAPTHNLRQARERDERDAYLRKIFVKSLEAQTA